MFVDGEGEGEEEIRGNTERKKKTKQCRKDDACSLIQEMGTGEKKKAHRTLKYETKV